MKKIVCLAILLLLTACGSPQNSELQSVSQSEDSAPSTVQNMSDEQLYEQYILPFVSAPIIYYFEFPYISGDDRNIMLYFYAYNQLPADSAAGLVTTYPDYGEVPAENVETYIMQYFDVTPEYIRNDNSYNTERNTYTFYASNFAFETYKPSQFEWRQDGELLVFDLYYINGFETQTLYYTLTLRPEGDTCKYIRGFPYTNEHIVIPPIDEFSRIIDRSGFEIADTAEFYEVTQGLWNFLPNKFYEDEQGGYIWVEKNAGGQYLLGFTGRYDEWEHNYGTKYVITETQKNDVCYLLRLKYHSGAQSGFGAPSYATADIYFDFDTPKDNKISVLLPGFEPLVDVQYAGANYEDALLNTYYKDKNLKPILTSPDKKFDIVSLRRYDGVDFSAEQFAAVEKANGKAVYLGGDFPGKPLYVDQGTFFDKQNRLWCGNGRLVRCFSMQSGVALIPIEDFSGRNPNDGDSYKLCVNLLYDRTNDLFLIISATLNSDGWERMPTTIEVYGNDFKLQKSIKTEVRAHYRNGVASIIDGETTIKNRTITINVTSSTNDVKTGVFSYEY